VSFSFKGEFCGSGAWLAVETRARLGVLNVKSFEVMPALICTFFYVIKSIFLKDDSANRKKDQN